MTIEATHTLRMRPRYVWVSEGPPEAFVARLRELVSFDPAVDIVCQPRHAVLSIPEEARHTWSPVLDLEAAALGDDRTRICARLGPDPHVWTFLVFLYAATGLPSFFASMFGLAQLAMGEPAWGLAALPAVLVAWAAIYSSSFVGRGLGALQIHQLLAVVEATLSVDAEEVE